MSSTPERPAFMEHEQQHPAEHFSVLTPSAFLSDFQTEAKRAFQEFPNRKLNMNNPLTTRPRMGLEAMWVEFYGEEGPKKIFQIAEDLANRGFHIEVHRDWYSQTIRDERILFLPPTRIARRNERSHRKLVSGFSEFRFKRLEDAGVSVVETNPPQNVIDLVTYLFKDRNHKKIIFIKTPTREVGWVGGMNIGRVHFEMVDCMVKLTDPRIVEPLISEFSRINENRRKKSVEIPCTEDTSLLVDALGDESKIMQKTIEMIDRAEKSIYIMSALHPDGKTLKALNRAKKRGVHVTYITIDPKFAGGLWAIQSFITDMKALALRRKIPLTYIENKLVHGKVLVVDEEEAIVGSHNFVDVPHEELSLYSGNPRLIRNLVGFLEDTIGAENLRKKIEEDTVVPLLAA